MKAAVWITLGAIATTFTGCVLPRFGTPLPAERQREGYTAVLPVRIEDVKSGPAEKLKEIGNKVLTTLASGGDSRLIPPARSEALLRTNGCSTDLLYLYRDGQITNQIAGFDKVQALLSRAGIKYAVQTQILFVPARVESDAAQGGFAISWGGTVTVRMQLVGVSPCRLLGEAEATQDYSQTSGAFFIVPFYIGTTMGRAVGIAAEKALSKLLGVSLP